MLIYIMNKLYKPTLNILTRTGNREEYFKLLKRSINEQTYKNFRHIKSNDNPSCEYLKNETDVINVEKNPGLGLAFYNLYLNNLGAEVKEGWILILDDDSKLVDKRFLEKLADKCSKSLENEILIFQSILSPKKSIFPDNNDFKKKNIRRAGIDMACICFHYSLLKVFSFDGRRMGDFNFLNKIKENKNYRFNFVTLPLGIWANYDGQKLGGN